MTNNLKIIIILSIFVSILTGYFYFLSPSFVKKEENNQLISNNNNDDKETKDKENEENEELGTNENEYFFAILSSQKTKNVLLFLVTVILFFFWENDKLPNSGFDSKLYERCYGKCDYNCDYYCDIKTHLCGSKYSGRKGIFAKENWFGFATLGALIIITLLVDLVLNHLLIGSISYFLSKDKNKKYLHTLKMSLKKRIKLFSSFSKTKIVVLSLCYLLIGFVVAVIARSIRKCHPYCCRRDTYFGEIIIDHGKTYCLGYCKPSEPPLSDEEKALQNIHAQDEE